MHRPNMRQLLAPSASLSSTGAVSAREEAVSQSNPDAVEYCLEPSSDEVLDSVLPKYIQSRIHECLLTSAHKLQVDRTLHTATDNARNLVEDLTRKL